MSRDAPPAGVASEKGRSPGKTPRPAPTGTEPARCDLHGDETATGLRESADAGVRTLDRAAVREAITTLGTGFLRHPDNDALRKALEDQGEVTPRRLHRALLRTVYRLLFLFIAEDRGILLDPHASQQARDRYTRFFSTARLRRIAALPGPDPSEDRSRGRRRASVPGGLPERGPPGRSRNQWRTLVSVLDGLGREGGVPELALPALGGLFEQTGIDALLHECSLDDEHLLEAIRSLSQVRDHKTHRTLWVDFARMDVEELGSLYESLLEHVPGYDPAERAFVLRRLGGNERKISGSYYTPPSLVEALLDAALDPVIDDALESGRTAAERERALLSLTVCDPACGPGRFLVAAARRIAGRLAFVRTGDPRPPARQVRRALREVIAGCVYGVDLNPMAIELAKVSLWLEAGEPGRPLSFLDAHLKVGNALLGATPALLAGGLPDEAFTPIEGDDRNWAQTLKKRNRAEREALKGHQSIRPSHRGEETGPAGKELADAWCAAFCWVKTPRAAPPVTTRTLLDLARDPDSVAPETRAEIARLAERYRFFHWHLEFPGVFGGRGGAPDERTGWSGGFSCVLGNPPWERIKLHDREFFATRDERIAAAPTKAARDRLIRALAEENPTLHAEYTAARRRAEATGHFLRRSGRYPHTGRGDINTYAVFAESGRAIVGPHGRVGLIVPTGIATDATTRHFFRDVVASGRLASLHDFENTAPLFSGVHRSFKFALLTLTGRAERKASADFAFYLHDPAELRAPARRFRLSPREIALLNPNTGTCPVFRSRRDAEITLGIYRRVPVLLRRGEPDGNPWGVSFLRMFDMSADSHLFRTRRRLEAEGWRLEGNVFTRDGRRYLPLYEAKMLHHHDHRWATYEADGSIRDVTAEEKRDPGFVVMPRYWVPEHDVPTGRTDRRGRPVMAPGVRSRLAARGWTAGWMLGFRNACRATDERTFIGHLLPRAGVGNSMPVIITDDASCAPALMACLQSFVLDFVVRAKAGGANMNFFIVEQLPVLQRSRLPEPAPWDGTATLADWLGARFLELSHTSGDLGLLPVAPFRWEEERRRLLRAELDAAFFHLYGIKRDDVDYIMDTFPIVRRKDLAAFGRYRTKELILAAYDAMARAIRCKEPYRTPLDPPPAQGLSQVRLITAEAPKVQPPGGRAAR